MFTFTDMFTNVLTSTNSIFLCDVMINIVRKMNKPSSNPG